MCYSRDCSRFLPSLPPPSAPRSRIAGPPIQLGWEATCNKCYDFEEYDKDRAADRADGGAPHWTTPERQRLLREAGFSNAEIMAGQKMATVIRNKRRSTVRNLHAWKRHERTEELMRSLTCKKEGVIDYGRKTVPTDGVHETVPTDGVDFKVTPAVSPIFSKPPCSCCTLHYLENPDKATVEMYKCDEGTRVMGYVFNHHPW